MDYLTIKKRITEPNASTILVHLKKPDAYKSLQSSSIRPTEVKKLKIAIDILYSA